ncbi:MAG: c-type cytochrome [Gemmatimonadota bacterium]
MRRSAAVMLVLVVAASACDGQPDPAADPDAPTAADTLVMAYESFSPEAFDTVGWPSDSAALERGAFVYRAGCSTCHGVDGRGDAGHVTPAGDTLHPPDFHRADFALGDDLQALRQKVYAGNVQGMPHWGLRRMDPRDIDAVARWVAHLARQQ